MRQTYYLLFISMLLLGLSGCASMSKKECETANWQSIGYSDGSRGIHHANLNKHHQACGKYDITPDAHAYRAGWDQGIRSYCTADRGYRAGSAGKAYQNICPKDVEANFLSGWRQGINRYCTAESGLRQGLAGRSYHGVCPAESELAFHDFYRLGRDVRSARATHKKAERNVEKKEKALAAEKNSRKHRQLLHELERLQYEEEQRDKIELSLEACMSGDWYDTGYHDGENGYPRRAGEIATVCRDYGIGPDRAGYREGWTEGNHYYCTYENGLYLGQTNRPYSGVCAGVQHQRFWHGYERGRAIFRSDRYEAHPKPAKRKAKRTTPKKSLPEHIKESRDQGRDQEYDDKWGDRDGQGEDRRRDQQHKPAEIEHDNRDKLKHPMPEQSRKEQSEEERTRQGEDVERD